MRNSAVEKLNVHDFTQNLLKLMVEFTKFC